LQGIIGQMTNLRKAAISQKLYVAPASKIAQIFIDSCERETYRSTSTKGMRTLSNDPYSNWKVLEVTQV